MYNLNELLWQFTLQCNKNCKYCGSKSELNKDKQTKINRMQIADEIINANPKQVTITGGEPSVLIDELIDCVKKIANSGIIVNILTNGNLFVQDRFNELKDIVSVFGISINEEQDLFYAQNIFNKIPFEKTTMITNFGTHNIDLFEKLSKFSVNFATWQVQLTMGNNFQLDLDDIENLKKKIDDFRNKKMVGIIQADNLICGKCHAGILGCSICWNGDVIPCLSYRAWKNNLDVQGNVFQKSLKNIWNNKFSFYRNRRFFPCCKCITGIELIKKKDKNALEQIINNVPKSGDNDIPMPKNVLVYGVKINPKDTFVVYGVGIATDQPTC